MLDANIDLLLAQWRASPKLRFLVERSIATGNGVLDAVAELERMWHIDTAEGVWLDYIGGRLGVERPAVVSPSQDPRWGFEGVPQARPFDLAPFRGATENAALFPLNDSLYRRVLKARGLTTISAATLANFEDAVHMISANAIITDTRDMTATIRTDDTALLRLADDLDALPRPAGVRIVYQALTAFGFEGAGVGFDQGPFRGFD